jgi:hypothetical protein
MNANRFHQLTGGNPLQFYEGFHAFTTTGLTKTVSVPFSTVVSCGAKPIGAAATANRQVPVPLGAVAATTAYGFQFPSIAGTLVAAYISVQTTHATHSDNHWSFTLVNKGAAGAGTTDMIIASAVNSTDAELGAAITAYIPRSLSVHGTAANLAFAANDYGLFTATKAASAVSLVGAHLLLVVSVGDPGESDLSVNNTVSGTIGTGDAVIKGSNGSTDLIVTRTGANVTSGRKFSLEAWGY